jgi:hypothetical protein
VQDSTQRESLYTTVQADFYDCAHESHYAAQAVAFDFCTVRCAAKERKSVKGCQQKGRSEVKPLCLRTPLGELYFENEAALLAQVADLLAQVSVIIDAKAGPVQPREPEREIAGGPWRAPHSMCTDLGEAA